MAPPELGTLITITGSVGGLAVIIHYGSKAALRLIAGITAIAAKDDNKSRPQRALEVLREIRHDNQPLTQTQPPALTRPSRQNPVRPQGNPAQLHGPDNDQLPGTPPPPNV